MFSAFSCCAASACLSPSLCAPAGVASHSTPVATTAQPARRLGSLAGVGGLGERGGQDLSRSEEQVTTNVLLRDLDVRMPNVADGRWLEVVADGLPLFGGAQLAVDTTLVCALWRDGNPTNNAANEDGAALRRARQRKVRTYPELVGRHARAKLVVLALKWVGGGLRRLVPSSPNSPKHVPEARTNCCVNGWSRRGAFVGLSGGLHSCKSSGNELAGTPGRPWL